MKLRLNTRAEHIASTVCRSVLKVKGGCVLMSSWHVRCLALGKNKPVESIGCTADSFQQR